MASIWESQSTASQPSGWRRSFRHRFAHLWPRAAAAYVRDLSIRLPESPGHQKIAALTFDDGPTDAGTPLLLECLARHGLKATFFVLGENVRRFPARAREIVAAGHSLGNHFRRHIDCWKTRPREVIREITEGTRIIEETAGVSPAWCRPPFGRLTHAVVKWSRIHQQPIALWDVFPADYLEETTAESLRQVLEGRLRARSIVCLHDNVVSMQKTPAMLGQSLPGLISAGWSFSPLPGATARNASTQPTPPAAALIGAGSVDDGALDISANARDAAA
ncbi:Peptidoglycan-N-acetylglucosamine deacetylase [Caulifigura coniformis]|uniref:Peptidoglycan-N-acetylglucosamine deacetylase n=1 Tax=Caulifigura coniformis TaxID=2527983 RepID=A0A517SE53_9PLAN|nr:polysaccharide deacetylase family protein [Caulifigura coniformis]QDT54391.1 Peptidoglycan-N-acetylglucosamine deacetylase [Caulifigura coniformis]